jgi:ribonuclease VapC
MFVDASAIVGILTREADAEVLIDRLERAIMAITSPIAVFEAAAGLCRKHHVSIEEAEADVAEFLAAARINMVPVAAQEAATALAAFSRYGKGRGHPAQLNMGDCFAYAVARNNRTSLLFKGNDFSYTDIAVPDGGSGTIA